MIIDQDISINAKEVVQMVPVLIGNLIVVKDVGQSRDGAEDILNKEKKCDRWLLAT